MSIENNLESIAQSLKIIADLLTVQTANKAVQNATPTPTIPAPTPAPVVVAAPVVSVSPVPVPIVVTPVVAMPAPPTFTAAVAAPAPVADAAPVFANKQAMMDFVLSSYKALGAVKGAHIQGVLEAMGYTNINDVPSEKWNDLKTGIEALK